MSLAAPSLQRGQHQPHRLHKPRLLPGERDGISLLGHAGTHLDLNKQQGLRISRDDINFAAAGFQSSMARISKPRCRRTAATSSSASRPRYSTARFLTLLIPRR